jgi:hypothetical protein
MPYISYVTPSPVQKAKDCSATDKEIHDTILISAMFCMCNRYVDGLGTSAVEDRNFYIERGKMRAEEGYLHFDLNKQCREMVFSHTLL